MAGLDKKSQERGQVRMVPAEEATSETERLLLPAMNDAGILGFQRRGIRSVARDEA